MGYNNVDTCELLIEKQTNKQTNKQMHKQTKSRTLKGIFISQVSVIMRDEICTHVTL